MNPFIRQQSPVGDAAQISQQAPVLSPDALDIAKRQRMAKLMLEQGQQPLEGREVSGRYVAPSWTQYLAKGLNTYLGGKTQEDVDKSVVEFGQKQAQQRQQDLQKYAEALRGTPAVEGGAPATPANPQMAAQVLLQSQDPELRQMGMKQMMEQPKFGSSPHYDQSGRAYLVSDRGEIKYLDGVSARDKMEIAPSGVAYNPYAVKEGQVFNDPNKLIALDASGNPVINQPLLGAKRDISRAGAANVSVNTATKPFLTELGKGAAEAVMGGYSGAQSAQQTLANVQQIKSGLDKAILGPGANARITLSQVGQVLGVGGKDASEQLQNTRNVMQGLARQELSAAASMKGQGQITESERAILRKAESGQINELTKPEVQTLLAALEKTANYRISQHEKNMSRIRKDPAAGAVSDFLEVQRPGNTSAGTGLPSGWKVLP